MYKNILVCLDGSEMDGAIIQAATSLATHLKAHLHGMTVVDVLTLEGPLMYDISGSLAFIPQMNFMAETRKVMEERAKNILTGFRSACDEAAAEHDESIVEGIVHKVIVEKAELNDLTLMGRKGLNYGFDKELLGSTTDRVIRKTRAPVLVVTHQFEGLKNPLLAYDGSHEAKKAMATAARLCGDLKLPLTVLQVTRNPAEGKKVLQEAKEYLDSHPLIAKYELVEGKPHEEVPQYAKRHFHDLLIMGARGHAGLIDYLLGSTTEYALWSGACHVLVDR
jgi:Universal stress protein UspA and related nucleotide-binding proteins